MVTNQSNHRDAFRAVADPTRRGILLLLAAGPLAVGEIALEFPVSRPAISKHLRILEQAQLVSEVRQGRRHVYKVSPGPLSAVRSWLDLFSSPAGKPAKEPEVRPAKPAAPPPKKVEIVSVESDWRQW
jgi:DNA-binding transcriptional ArsR family regulator